MVSHRGRPIFISIYFSHGNEKAVPFLDMDQALNVHKCFETGMR